MTSHLLFIYFRLMNDSITIIISLRNSWRHSCGILIQTPWHNNDVYKQNTTWNKIWKLFNMFLLSMIFSSLCCIYLKDVQHENHIKTKIFIFVPCKRIWSTYFLGLEIIQHLKYFLTLLIGPEKKNTNISNQFLYFNNNHIQYIVSHNKIVICLTTGKKMADTHSFIYL